MNVLLQTTAPAPTVQRVRLISAKEFETLEEVGFGTASAKTVGGLATDPTAPGTLLLGIGEASTGDCLLAGRKLVVGLRDTPQDLHIATGDLPAGPLKAFVRGLHIGPYQVDLWKGERPAAPLDDTTLYLQSDLGGDLQAMLAEAKAIADGQLAAMHLVDRPANAKRPTDVAKYITDLAGLHGFEAEVVESEALEIQGFGGILAVGRASDHPPCLVKLKYAGPASAYHLGLIGKGVTFDSGGISIKASKNMGFMKSDIGGAAAVLGTFVTAAGLGLPVTLTGLIPLAENVIAGNAYLPSDVIRNYGGKTIEITDTDAEGRLMLADSLAYLPELATPDFTIDVATLTGSAVQTFGYECAAAFTNDDEAYRQLAAAGDAVGERIWRLPLWEAYESELKSDVADIKHYHGLPIAGAINAAKFLEYFAADKARWMHLDIAGVAFAASSFTKDRAATGYGVALLTSYLQSLTHVD